MLGFIQNISATQLIFILLIILLLFGAKRLPELARSFGKSLKEFKHATKDIEQDFRTAMDEDDTPKAGPSPDKRPDDTTYASEKVPSDSDSAKEKSSREG